MFNNHKRQVGLFLNYSGNCLAAAGRSRHASNQRHEVEGFSKEQCQIFRQATHQKEEGFFCVFAKFRTSDLRDVSPCNGARNSTLFDKLGNASCRHPAMSYPSRFFVWLGKCVSVKVSSLRCFNKSFLLEKSSAFVKPLLVMCEYRTHHGGSKQRKAAIGLSIVRSIRQ